MGHRRKMRGRDPRGEAWTGNKCLDEQVLTVLIENPFPRDGDEVSHFNVAPGMRAKVRQAFTRLIKDGKARWTRDKVIKKDFLVAVASPAHSRSD